MGAGLLGVLLPAAVGAPAAGATHPVLVELFTSEGCSSCPPADALLRRLVMDQPVPGVRVIGLEEHVDYWNGLGWRDPFSAARFTRRKYGYASALHLAAAYTPQMVVNGRLAFIGSDAARARSAIASAAAARLATVSVVRTYAGGDTVGLQLRVRRLPASPADRTAEVWLALAEDGLADRVTGGENAGRRLVHDAVVRRLELIGRIDATPGRAWRAERMLKVASGWRNNPLHAVVFVQGTSSRNILGIASVALGPGNSHDESRGVK